MHKRLLASIARRISYGSSAEETRERDADGSRPVLTFNSPLLPKATNFIRGVNLRTVLSDDLGANIAKNAFIGIQNDVRYGLFNLHDSRRVIMFSRLIEHPVAVAYVSGHICHAGRDSRKTCYLVVDGACRTWLIRPDDYAPFRPSLGSVIRYINFVQP